MTGTSSTGSGAADGARVGVLDPGRWDAESVAADAALTAVVVARQAQAAAEADEAEALLVLSGAYPRIDGYGRELAERAVLHELMAALGCSQRTAANRLGWARALGEVPALAAAMRAGTVDATRSWTTLQAIAVLPDVTSRREAVARLLAAHAARTDGLTAGQWSRLLGRVVAVLDPGGAERRQVRSRRDRQVRHIPPSAAGDHGDLLVRGPAERVAICAETVDALARAWAADGVPGTLDQLRFDALEWLITRPTGTGLDDTPHDNHHDDTPRGNHNDVDRHDDDRDVPAAPERDVPAAPDPDEAAEETRDERSEDAAPTGTASGGTTPGGVFRRPPSSGCPCGGSSGGRGRVVAQVTVSLSTLLGLDDTPGDLDGVGAVPASVARELAATAETWRRLLTDPADGHLVTQAIAGYRPTAAMRRYVLTRANHTGAARGCTCRRRLQLDHTRPWPFGPTSAGELAPLHEPHHDGKTHGRWRHRLDPDTGALTQTSPLGRTYTTAPLPPLGGSLTGPTPRCPTAGDGGTGARSARDIRPDHLRPDHLRPGLLRCTWTQVHAWVHPHWAVDPPPDWDEHNDVYAEPPTA